MPILKIQKNKNYTYAIWEIEEDLDTLLNMLNTSQSEYTEIHNISHIKRRKQNIAARLLLNHLAGKKVELKYTKNGAPYCKKFKHISISHSKNYCALIISEKNIGIDIQYQKKNIVELQNKFINTIEGIHLKTQNKNEKLHFMWCAKEAIYKTIHNQACSFLKDIHIDCDQSTMNTIGYYKNSQKYQINYSSFKDYFIAIATHVS